ncbi:MAG TPA: hypothetical protein VI248_08380 [Kineosporiaceae bacterium]
MKPKGPLVTLAAGAVLAAGLLIANFSFSTAQQGASSASVAASSPSSTPSSSTPSSSMPSSSMPSSSIPSPVATTSAAVPAADAVPMTYAGRVTGGGSLSVVAKGTGAVAYLCDGLHEAWLWGPASADTLNLRNAKGDTLAASRGGGKLTGSLTVHGRTWTVALRTVKKPSGLYRATATVRGASVVAGWVVLPDGSQVGAWTTDDGAVTPAPPIELGSGAVTVDGQRMTATPLDPATTPLG